MLKDVVLRQKKEKEDFIKPQYIERTQDVLGKKWLDSNLIKVILGPRRAGKSIFSLMLLKDRSFAYFNFDDEILTSSKGISTDELMKELHAVYGDTKNIFFDEIQNLPNWELFVNRLHREGYNLILTGSNAKLLSKELATTLTGRYIPIEILPFNFKEFLRAKGFIIENNLLPQKHGELLKLMEEYLINGGFPEVIVKKLDSKEYLDVLFDSVLFKDVVKRYKVRFSVQIGNLGSHLVNSFSSLYSLRKLQDILGLKSVTTVEKYTKYLEEAYLIFSLLRYSPKSLQRIRSPKKVYVVDNGFIGAKAIQHSPDKGKLMENLVFLELIKRGLEPNHDIFYFKTKTGKEIDFVIKNETVVSQLIQSSYDIENQDTEKREISALQEASRELKTKDVLILTWDTEKEIKENNLTIKFQPIWKWMME